jgi:hypothetical protein
VCATTVLTTHEQKYADQLAESGTSYGASLFYYSRAHKPKKLMEVLHGLITLCVVQSAAYPPKQNLDGLLRNLLKSPLQAVQLLNTEDLEAGQYLSTYLSGYATIRRFYELRDGEIDMEDEDEMIDEKDRLPLAAAALMAAITSSSEGIRDGLLDATVNAVVPVDNLLVLLGESLAFVNRMIIPRSPAAQIQTNVGLEQAKVLTLSQATALLKVVEDLETVGANIMARCEVRYQATLANAHDWTAGWPQDMAVRKSTSHATTASSQFSLIDSSMFKSRAAPSAPSTAAPSIEGSGLLVTGPMHRTWDWRKGLEKDTRASDVLKILRLGLARELARGWTDMDL